MSECWHFGSRILLFVPWYHWKIRQNTRSKKERKREIMKCSSILKRQLNWCTVFNIPIYSTHQQSISIWRINLVSKVVCMPLSSLRSNPLDFPFIFIYIMIVEASWEEKTPTWRLFLLWVSKQTNWVCSAHIQTHCAYEFWRLSGHLIYIYSDNAEKKSFLFEMILIF